MSCSPTHPVPPGRFAFFGRIPGNKLPGYDHPVPPGQQTSLTTVRKIEATPGSLPRMGLMGLMGRISLMSPIGHIRISGRQVALPTAGSSHQRIEDEHDEGRTPISRRSF